jgi:hypothetical protein
VRKGKEIEAIESIELNKFISFIGLEERERERKK